MPCVIISNICYVSGLSYLVFVCLGFVVSSVRLSRVCDGTLHLKECALNIWKFSWSFRRMSEEFYNVHASMPQQTEQKYYRFRKLYFTCTKCLYVRGIYEIHQKKFHFYEFFQLFFTHSQQNYRTELARYHKSRKFGFNTCAICKRSKKKSVLCEIQ